jgi:hypothetical protein
LNHNLDETLTDLDGRFNEVEYPRITMANKQNHNPEFNKYLSATEKNAYLEEIKPQLIQKIY